MDRIIGPLRKTGTLDLDLLLKYDMLKIRHETRLNFDIFLMDPLHSGRYLSGV